MDSCSSPKRFLSLLGLSVLLVPVVLGACSSDAPKRKATVAYLFSQTAESATVVPQQHGAVVTLHNVSPSTTRFTDSPGRVVDTLTTQGFNAKWSDYFAKSAPNASFSYMNKGAPGGGTGVGTIVGHAYENDSVTYTVKPLSGADDRRNWKGQPLSAMPAETGAVSVVIDSGELPGDVNATDNVAAPAVRHQWRQWHMNRAATGHADPLDVQISAGSWPSWNSADGRLTYTGPMDDKGSMLYYEPASGVFAWTYYDYSTTGDPMTQVISQGNLGPGFQQPLFAYLDEDLILEWYQNGQRLRQLDRDAQGAQSPVGQVLAQNSVTQHYGGQFVYIGNDYLLFFHTSPNTSANQQEPELLKLNRDARGSDPIWSTVSSGWTIDTYDALDSSYTYVDGNVLLVLGDYPKGKKWPYYFTTYALDTSATPPMRQMTQGTWKSIQMGTATAVYAGNDTVLVLGEST